MSEDTADVSPLRATLVRWPLALVLVLIGTGAGVGLATRAPTTYTAETRLAVGSADISAQAVPGFALASSQLASNYARFVTADVVLAKVPPADAARISAVSASPIPDSNVIRIEASASSEASAVLAAKTSATLLVAQVAAATVNTTPDSVLSDYAKISAQVATLQQQQGDLQSQLGAVRGNATSGTRTPSARETDLVDQLQALNAKLYLLEIQQSALGGKYQTLVNAPTSQTSLSIVQPAGPSTDDHRSRLERYGLGGLVLGGMLALVLATGLERRSARRRRRRARGERMEAAADSAGQRRLGVAHDG
jgi:hypothetical protein